MKLSLCICVCVILVGLVKSSPMVTRSNYRGKRGNHQPFVPPPCNNETTLICRHLPNGDFDACMNPRAAQEQIRLGHATLGECPDCFCDVAELEDTCIENPQAGEHLIFNGTCYKNANECPTSCDDSCPSACDDTCPTSCDDACPSACGDQSVCPAACAELLDNCTCDDGQDGVDGQDGTNGINGTNGVDGVNGQDGDDGATGNCTNCPAPQQNIKACCYISLLGAVPSDQPPLPGVGHPHPYISQIIWLARNSCSALSGYATCSGQLLGISQNQALFSVMGNKYGGDPRTNFNLPDTRGMKGIVEMM